MEELIKYFRENVFNDFTEEIKKISDFWDILAKYEISTTPELLEFVQLVFIKSVEKASDEGISYDYRLIYDSDIVQRYKKKVEEIPDIMELPITLPYIDKLSKEFFNELLENGNQLAIMADTGTKGSKEILFRTFIADGFKIDVETKVVSFIYSSLFEGYQTYDDRFMASQTGRRAAIINANSVSQIGYLSKKVSLVNKNVRINYDHDEEKCEPKLKVSINSKNVTLFTGRYYIDKNGVKQLVNRDTLPGSYMLFSPINCKSHGQTICKTCFGKLWKAAKKLKTLGTFVAYILEAITQSLLSSKHQANVILPWIDYVEYLQEMSDAKIKYFKAPVGKYHIVDGAVVDIASGETLPFTCRNLFVKDYDKDGFIIFGSEDFWYSKDTNSLLPLTNSLFNKTGSFSEINNIEEYYNRMMAYNETAGIKAPSLMWEIILMGMCKQTDDLTLLHKENRDVPYEICSLQKSILTNGTTLALEFERFEEQISDPKFYKKRIKKDGTVAFYWGK
jgi:hypothetical protein